MAMGASPSGGGNNSKRLMAEINVTPMVDVMLVLLVIFMITAPVIKQIEGIQANLPQLTDGASQTIVTEDARTLVISAEGSVTRAEAGKDAAGYVDLTQLTSDLVQYKDDSEHGKKTPVVVIAADRETKWERVMQVWNSVKAAGIAQVSFQVADR